MPTESGTVEQEIALLCHVSGVPTHRVATEAALPDDIDLVRKVNKAWVPVLARRLMA